MKTMYVYILKCSDDSFYIGVTNDLEMRFEQHIQGINRNCYTFSRRPLEIVFYELFNDPLSAIAFEKKLKGWSKVKKQALVEKNWDRLKVLSICKNDSHSKNATSSSHFDSAQCDTKITAQNNQQ
ncbi:MAG TPA: GIY-YIG nuclease family protein [Bacteroidia bacterium]|nr:GIY-YIG nuclease family protein [Bacteroidia bacterium]